MRPSNHVQNDHNSSQLVSQIWQRSGSCPDGTIPIRRIRKQDLLRATSLENFGKKMPVHSSYSPTDDKGTVYINSTRVELGPQVNRSVSKHREDLINKVYFDPCLTCAKLCLLGCYPVNYWIQLHRCSRRYKYLDSKS